VRTASDADAVAGVVGLDPLRRALLVWIVQRNPERISAFLSPTELFTLGMNGQALPAAADDWGAPAEARLGCLCLRMPRQQPRDLLTGRWESGILLSDVADLNLRLAELLTELQMPASLLGPVLASATLDMIHGVTSRHQDDRRAFAEYITALKADRLEQYLAFLTTGGPLVPLDDGDRDVVPSADIQPRTERRR
jgi:hypothetical protein